MNIPIFNLASVHHIGTLDATKRGHFIGESLEGHLLSVSTCPQAWQAIARIGGAPLYEMTLKNGQRAVFADMPAILYKTPYQAMRDRIVQYCIGEGYARPGLLWRSYDTDEEGGWRFSTYATRAEAIAECPALDEEEYADGDPESIPSEKGHFLVESYETYIASPRLLAHVRQRSCGQDALEWMAMVWLEEVVAPVVPTLVGAWWQDAYDPDALSAPRGGIFPDRIQDFETRTVSIAVATDAPNKPRKGKVAADLPAPSAQQIADATSRREAELIIARLVETRSMSRAEAIVAITMQDGRQRHLGQDPLVPGRALYELYVLEMDDPYGEPMTTERAAHVIAYVFDITVEQAARNLKQRVASGDIPLEAMH